MTVKAKELTVGQQIQVEYGDYDNWGRFPDRRDPGR